MKRLLSGIVTAATLSAAGVDWRQSAFANADGWSTWAARPEIAPRTYIEPVISRGEAGSLAVSGNSNAAAYGGWERPIDVQPGRWYKFVAHYKASTVSHEAVQVVARIDWRTPDKRAGQPDYAWKVIPVGEGWKRLEVEAPAPAKAARANLQLYIQNAPQGVVYWDDLSFSEIATPGPRKVTVASVNFRPPRTGDAALSVRKFLELVDSKVSTGTDVILLPEGITIVSTGKKYADVAETIPGPTTTKLGEMAKQKNAYIVAGIYEREGVAMYNTAVLLDRKGQLVGKYRKVYLPREEIEGGLTPGNDYPVFTTDFGKVGVMICWDLQYADPARALARRGAEMLLLPIWGGNEHLGKARAIENRVFLIASGYDYPTYIMDPDGEILSVAKDNGTLAAATIDLNKRYYDEWLGDMRGRFMKEIRVDVATEPNE
ncbi:MAG: carbon-nitrogen hydrolase family protein [Bryobacterales bacterium]|nr:carbon-nitrogen hydrolase family protein [Bryobacterales bacterium]